MRLRNIPGARETIASSRFVIHEEDLERTRGHWHEVFGSSLPIYIEVGMGKGKFITELALQHPDRCYIGIEKYSSVLLRALEKRETLTDLNNLYFIRMDAEDLPKVFAPNEVAGIYLNFSDPWPKDRHAKRRLPSRQFLARYDQILTPEGHIEFKTDNRPLFDFAVEEAKEAGWTLDVCTYDLHQDALLCAGNVMTEYEERFSAQGNPIHKMVLHREF